ncbi:RNA-binding protein Tab2/Atab2 [Gracilaria domingensis]|nr:RNA-binding protein Tab2/Atab2 [Gracilaria domingensis]
MNITQPLPDALRCDSFAFGSFPLGQLKQFFDEADPDQYFGEACLVDPELQDDLVVPGMIIFSKRAKALSAWISGTELAFIRVVLEKQQILFECGLRTVYKFAQITQDLKQDVRTFQQAKQQTNGIHFLAVQTDQQSEEVEGMWLLSELL